MEQEVWLRNWTQVAKVGSCWCYSLMPCPCAPPGVSPRERVGSGDETTDVSLWISFVKMAHIHCILWCVHRVIFAGFPVVVFTSGLEVTVVPERWSVRVGSGRIASRRQLPLKLAWAISIHKSQVWNVSGHSYITLDSTTVSFPDFFIYFFNFLKCLIIGHMLLGK